MRDEKTFYKITIITIITIITCFHEVKIILNNNQEELEGERLTVSELLKVKKFSFKMLIIKINGRLVKRESYDKEVIVDGDNVNVLHLISGG